jgi:hypothetical protein
MSQEMISVEESSELDQDCTFIKECVCSQLPFQYYLNSEQKIALYRKASEINDPRGHLLLGCMYEYESRKTLFSSYEIPKELYNKSIKGGCDLGYYLLGKLEREPRISDDLLRKAAWAGIYPKKVLTLEKAQELHEQWLAFKPKGARGTKSDWQGFSEISQYTVIEDDAYKVIAQFERDLYITLSVVDISEEACEYLRNSRPLLKFRLLSTINVSKAESLISSDKDLLMFMPDLDDSVLAVLSKLKSTLGLGVSHLTAQAEKILENRRYETWLPNLKVLRNALIARKFGNSMYNIQEVSLQVAESLFSPGDTTSNFNQLRTCNSELASLLSSAKEIILDELVDIDEDVAKCFAKCSSKISLNGLKQISCTTAEVLASSTASLSLDGLTVISEDLYVVLSRHQGPALSLNGISMISNKSASALSAYAGELSLNGIQTLENCDGHIELMKQIIKNCDCIWLPSLMYAPEPILSLLVKKKSLLNLSGLENITESDSKILSTHIGELHLRGLSGVISSEVALNLCKHNGVITFGADKNFTYNLEDSGHIALLKKILKDEKDYSIYSCHVENSVDEQKLKELSIPVVEILSTFVRDLVFRDLLAITDQCANVLLRCKCESLSFDSIKQLSPSVAKIIAKHKKTCN